MNKLFIPKIHGISLNLINSDILEYLSNFYYVESNFYGKAVHKKYDLVIQHYSANPRKFIFSVDKKIVIQPVDGSLIDKRHINDIVKYDLVLTPSENSKKILEISGIPSNKIEIIPNYYRDDIFNDNGFYNKSFNKKKYTFYTETTGIIRKNVKNLIKHFLNTFNSNDNVRLIVKLSKAKDSLFEEIKNILSDFKNPPEVIFINKMLEQEDLESLMNGIDCYVCLSYMEGFCIPLLNAAVLKKDIIAFDSELSGYTDFLDKDNAILLPVQRIIIDQKGESVLIYTRDCEWEEPNYLDYEKALIDCYKGIYPFNRHHDFNRFSKENVMDQYLKVVKKILKK